MPTSPFLRHRLAAFLSSMKASLRILTISTLAFLVASSSSVANVAGGVTSAGANVSVQDNGDGTVTMSNGIVAIVIVKSSSRLNSVKYTYNNSGAPVTSETLSGNGQYYYGGFMLGNGVYEYTLAVDPASNSGNYADVKLLSVSPNNGIMETHFSMLRGSPGFYSSARLTHRPQDEKFEVGAWGVVTRVPGTFNWLSADATRNFLIGTQSKKGAKVPNSPHEISVNLDGTQQGNFADKFIYGQDHADLRAWGWSSVGSGGLNIGRWLMTTMEFSNGGPLKRDVSVYPYSELNNSILTGEVGMGSDGHLDKGEIWTKTCGPWFTYLNSIPANITKSSQAAKMLYRDALAQAAAEEKAWPYPWFTGANFVPASARGTVTGKIVIADSGNPQASSAGLWVGLQKQPQTCTGTYDFQKWLKPYQFWVKTDASGNFTIPHVIPDTNYTLYAFGPGAAGTFISQNQTGGNPPLELNLPAKPFSVSVSPGATVALGPVTWTPNRLGATVFELGFPSRKANKFRHGEDYWAPAVPPKLGYPTPMWGGQMEFPSDYPDGLDYTVGKNQWPRDWNYILPSLPNAAGAYQPCTGTINFELAQTPAPGTKASLYIACAGDDGGKIIVRVNEKNLGETAGVAAAPNALAIEGFDPPPHYSDDSSIHFSDHGPFSDQRITFSGDLLHVGKNSIAIQMDARRMTSHLMLDYLRLELTGYVPPPPKSVTAYAGKGSVFLTWPVVPGATSYTIQRSASLTGPFKALANHLPGPVCGSGTTIVTFRDTTAEEGTPYFYAVQSVNPVGKSAASSPSAAASASSQITSAAPTPPTGLRVVRSGHHQVALQWTPSASANLYVVRRTTLLSDGDGGLIPLGTIVLEDALSGTSCIDTSCTDGRLYSYTVEAVNAIGSSAPSPSVNAQPLPAPPTTAPADLAGKWMKTRNGDALALSWSPVPGATGYVLYRVSGPGDAFEWPTHFLATMMTTTYTDQGNTDKKAKVKGLDRSIEYSYRVTAVNSAGISPSSTVKISPR